MTVNKWSMLAGCIAVAISGSTWAATNNTNNGATSPPAHHKKQLDTSSKSDVNIAQKQGRALLPTLNDDSGLGALIDNSHANIHLRTVYFNQHLPGDGHANGTTLGVGKGEKTQDWSGSTLGTQFNFHSGYAFGHIGFDASLYSAFRLTSSGNPYTADTNFFAINSKGKLPKTFSKLGRADIKFKAGDKALGVKGKVGYIGIEHDFLVGSTTRALPSSYRGFDVEGNVGSFDWYMDAANALGERSKSGMEHFTNHEGQTISYVGEVGGAYTFSNGLWLQAAYGKSQDYMNQYEGQATYLFNLSQSATLKLKGQHFGARKGGSLWDGTNTGFKDSAHANTLSATYTLNNLQLTGAYTKTYAKGGQGYYQYKMSANDYGAWNTPTSVDNDFNYDGENAYQGTVNYNFKDVIPGLQAGIMYTMGTGVNWKGNTAIQFQSEYEVDYGVYYKFQQPALKGLDLKLIDYDAYQKGVTQTDGKVYKDGHLNDLRIYMDYQIAVF